jgi:hypothetical protein
LDCANLWRAAAPFCGAGRVAEALLARGVAAFGLD